MSQTPFPSFDVEPATSLQESAEYQQGYRDGCLADQEAISVRLSTIAHALEDLSKYKKSYIDYINKYFVETLEHVLKSLVMPVSVSQSVVRARACSLLLQMEVNPQLHCFVKDPKSIKRYIPKDVVLHADKSLSRTDVRIVWGTTQATAAAYQQKLQERLVKWLAETLELATNQKKEK